MLRPLALVFYERLMPGSQLVNRLQDLHYRVLVVNDAKLLPATVKREMPLLLFADLASGGEICVAIEAIKSDSATAHLPVIVYAPENAPSLFAAAQKAGARLPVTDLGLLEHLEQLIDQALPVD